MILLLMLAATAGAPKPAALHTYKDWIVGCDNVRACQANALEPDPGDDDFLAPIISRGALAGDKAVLTVPLPDGTGAGDRFSIRVDGATASTFSAPAKPVAALPLTGGLLAALRNGRRLSLVDAGGKSLGAASLAGLAAALRYMDDQQGRVGAVGALAAVGARPDAATPPPPPVPVIDVPPPSSKPPRNLTVAEATRLIGPDSAVCEYANGKVAPRAYRLDAGHSLVLVDNPCGNGAYNFFTSVYVLDEAGAARPARFDVSAGMGEPDTDSNTITNGDWDTKTRSLTSYEKGRGLGDCGQSESYVWDGTRFRLLEQEEMDDCRGSVDFIRIWIARTGG